ncbi:MAG: YdcF family protein [Sandaracinaceae bacterium]
MGRLGLVLALALTSACARPRGAELFVHGAPLMRAEAIVVLGNRPAEERGRIARELDRRMRRGVGLFDAHLAPRLVLVGAPNEAPVMAARARELGVPDDALLVDATSRDTADNARTAVALLCRGRRDCHPRVIVVSSPYHLRRARMLFECAGARVQVAASPIPNDVAWQASRAAYEYGVGITYVFDDACARARGR